MNKNSSVKNKFSLEISKNSKLIIGLFVFVFFLLGFFEIYLGLGFLENPSWSLIEVLPLVLITASYLVLLFFYQKFLFATSDKLKSTIQDQLTSQLSFYPTHFHLQSLSKSLSHDIEEVVYQSFHKKYHFYVNTAMVLGIFIGLLFLSTSSAILLFGILLAYQIAAHFGFSQTFRQEARMESQGQKKVRMDSLQSDQSIAYSQPFERVDNFVRLIQRYNKYSEFFQKKQLVQNMIYGLFIPLVFIIALWSGEVFQTLAWVLAYCSLKSIFVMPSFSHQYYNQKIKSRRKNQLMGQLKSGLIGNTAYLGLMRENLDVIQTLFSKPLSQLFVDPTELKKSLDILSLWIVENDTISQWCMLDIDMLQENFNLSHYKAPKAIIFNKTKKLDLKIITDHFESVILVTSSPYCSLDQTPSFLMTPGEFYPIEDFGEETAKKTLFNFWAKRDHCFKSLLYDMKRFSRFKLGYSLLFMPEVVSTEIALIQKSIRSYDHMIVGPGRGVLLGLMNTSFEEFEAITKRLEQIGLAKSESYIYTTSFDHNLDKQNHNEAEQFIYNLLLSDKSQEPSLKVVGAKN